jgi:hypothetical protein
MISCVEGNTSDRADGAHPHPVPGFLGRHTALSYPFSGFSPAVARRICSRPDRPLLDRDLVRYLRRRSRPSPPFFPTSFGFGDSQGVYVSELARGPGRMGPTLTSGPHGSSSQSVRHTTTVVAGPLRGRTSAAQVLNVLLAAGELAEHVPCYARDVVLIPVIEQASRPGH